MPTLKMIDSYIDAIGRYPDLVLRSITINMFEAEMLLRELAPSLTAELVADAAARQRIHAQAFIKYRNVDIFGSITAPVGSLSSQLFERIAPATGTNPAQSLT